MSEVKVNKISPRSGTTVTLGDSGDTFTLASGVSLTGVNATFSGDLTVDTNTLYVDSSNNRVGIGNTDPSVPLHLSNSTPIIRLEDTNTSAYSDISADSSSGSLFIKADVGNTVANTVLGFFVDNTEAMRIDSSGNVLVGNTSNTTSQAGVYLNSNGRFFATHSGSSSIFNRLSSDGDILLFQKDTTTVGSIGVIGGDIPYFGTTDGSQCGINLDGDNQRINPANGSGSAIDNQIDLGASPQRFKNLYLGGSVYLGGTGSANALDDYEEGTWTPQLEFGGLGTGITFSASNTGSYIKIGKFVHLFFDLRLSSKGSATGQASLRNFPFTVVSTDARGTVVVGYYQNMNTVSGLTGRAEAPNTYATLSTNRDASTGNIIDLTDTNFNNNSRLLGTVTYQTT